jgi:hypothetical protein
MLELTQTHQTREVKEDTEKVELPRYPRSGDPGSFLLPLIAPLPPVNTLPLNDTKPSRILSTMMLAISPWSPQRTLPRVTSTPLPVLHP